MVLGISNMNQCGYKMMNGNMLLVEGGILRKGGQLHMFYEETSQLW